MTVQHLSPLELDDDNSLEKGKYELVHFFSLFSFFLITLLVTWLASNPRVYRAIDPKLLRGQAPAMY